MTKIKSRPIKRGDPKEATWLSDYGTGEKGVWVFSKAPEVNKFGKGGHLILDEIPPTENYADGKIYTSKKRFREATRQHGYVEVGEDLLTKQKRTQGNMERREQLPDHVKKELWDRIDSVYYKK